MRRQLSLTSATLLCVAFFECVSLARGQCIDGKCVGLAKCKSFFGDILTIDIRVGDDGECDHYLEVCCDHADIVDGPGTGGTGPGGPGIVGTGGGDGTGGSGPGGTGTGGTGGGDGTGGTGQGGTNDPNGNSNFVECGNRNPDGVGFRTVNGQHNETEFGEFPWMVALLQSEMLLGEESQTFICGGSLIAPNVVLTAAHCVYNKDPQSLIARAGEWDTRTDHEVRPFQEQRVRQTIVQPNYNSATQFNNIALLVLDQPFLADENVQMICLPPQGETFTDNNCFATGWGKSSFMSDAYQVILKKVQLPMVSHAQCQEALRRTRLGSNFRLHNSFICAGGEDGIDTCTGDGGSPLMCPFPGSETRYYQAGIVAWGIGCGTPGVPGVYVKNSLYTGWINQELQKLGIDDNLLSDY